MKIATMVRGYLPVPRPKDMVYAPIDLAVTISEGLAERGHAVEFFGPEGTKLYTATRSMGLRPLVENHTEWMSFLNNIAHHVHYVPAMWDMLLARTMFEEAQAGKFDLLHFHHPEIALPFAKLYPDVPVVYTQHDPLLPMYCEMYDIYRTDNQYFISISDNQRLPRPHLPFAATIYNGINTEQFDFSAEHDNYLLFAARMVPEKGLREAVQVALQSKQKLKIVGMLYPDAQAYFDEYVKPYLGKQIELVGYVPREEINTYYQRAKALLMPIQWEEPFGLSMIEAMACGTPVIAFRRGSVPEVVVDGKTGFIVDTIEEMCEAVKNISVINRKSCRRHVQRKFSNKHMIDNYEQVFKEIIESHQTDHQMNYKS